MPKIKKIADIGVLKRPRRRIFVIERLQRNQCDDCLIIINDLNEPGIPLSKSEVKIHPLSYNLFPGPVYEKVVEKLVLRQSPDAKPETRSAAELIRRKIARRAAAEFQDGMNINLGIYSTSTDGAAGNCVEF